MGTKMGTKMVFGEDTPRTARAIRSSVLLEAFARAGLVQIPSTSLGKMAGLSWLTAWRWMNGTPVSAESDRALRAALGISEKHGR